MLNQIINLQIQGTRQVSNQIRGVTNNLDNLAQAFNRSSKSQARHQGETRTSQQGLANIQAGLVQLSTWLLNANVKLSNYFASMQKGFADTETASVQLKNAMGLAGASSEQLNASGFIAFQNKVEEVALKTQFTAKEVYKAFEALTTSGRTKEEALAMLEPVLKLATASAGAIDLNEAIQIGIKSVTALDTEAKDMEKTLNKVYRTTQRSSVGISDMAGGLDSLRTAFMGFGKTKGISKEAELLGLLGLVKGGGSFGSAKEASQQVKSFANELGSLILLANRKSLLNRKGKGRKNIKKQSLMALFGFGEGTKFALDKSAQKEMEKIFGESYRSKSKESFVESMFLDEKGEYLGASKVVSNILKAFSVMKKNLGGGLAFSVLKKALGGEGAKTTITALMSGLTKKLVSEGADKTKITTEQVIGKLDSFLKDIDKVDGDLSKAEGEFLKTLQGRLNLLEGAEDKLSRTIFKHDVYANAVLDTYKETVLATNKLMEKNDTLASSVSFIGRMMQFLTGVGTTLGFTLTAMATFSIALTHSIDKAGFAVKGLGGTMRAFNGMFLAPTMTVLMQMTGGIIVLGIGIVALMRYFSGAEGIGEGFKIVLEKIGDTARATGGIIQLAFSSLSGKKSLEELTNDFYRYRKKKIALDRDLALHESGQTKLSALEYSIKKRQADYYFKHLKKINDELGIEGRKSLVKMELTGGRETVGTIARITDMIKNLTHGLAIIGESAIQPIMFSLEAVFTGLYYAVNAILTPIRYLAYFFGLASDETSFMAEVLKAFGTILGVIISGYLLSGAWSLFTGALTAIGSRFISVTQAVANYTQRQQAMMQATNYVTNTQGRNISVIDHLRLRYYELTGQTQRYTQALGQAVIRGQQNTQVQQQMINASQGLMMGVTALGGAITMLGDYTGNEATKSFGSWMTKIGMFSLMLPMIISGLGQFLTMLRAITVANIILAGATLKAWLPVLLIFGLIYTVYKLFSNTKPKKPNFGASAIPGQVPTTSNATTSMGLPTTATSYANPTTTASSYAEPMVGASGTYASSPAPASTVNNNNQQIVNVKNMYVNGDNAKQVANSIAKQAKKTSTYNSSGIGQ
jgi:hypothetical protein